MNQMSELRVAGRRDKAAGFPRSRTEAHLKVVAKQIRLRDGTSTPTDNDAIKVTNDLYP